MFGPDSLDDLGDSPSLSRYSSHSLDGKYQRNPASQFQPLDLEEQKFRTSKRKRGKFFWLFIILAVLAVLGGLYGALVGSGTISMSMFSSSNSASSSESFNQTSLQDSSTASGVFQSTGNFLPSSSSSSVQAIASSSAREFSSSSDSLMISSLTSSSEDFLLSRSTASSNFPSSSTVVATSQPISFSSSAEESKSSSATGLSEASSSISSSVAMMHSSSSSLSPSSSPLRSSSLSISSSAVLFSSSAAGSSSAASSTAGGSKSATGSSRSSSASSSRSISSSIALSSSSSGPGSPGRVFYIDFDNGDDLNDGRSPLTPHKRSPCDPLAIGIANNVIYQPYDRVLFKQGTIYRGSLFCDLKGNGNAGGRIFMLGSNHGYGIPGASAVLSGQELFVLNAVLLPKNFTVSPALPKNLNLSMAVAVNISVVMNVFTAVILTPVSKVFPSTLLYLSRYPPAADPFDFDNPAEVMPLCPDCVVNNPNITGAWNLTDGALVSLLKTIPQSRWSQLLFNIWGNPNVISSGSVLFIDEANNVTVVKVPAHRLYDPPRATWWIMFNDAAFITRPNEYSYELEVDASGNSITRLTIARPPGAYEFELSSRSTALQLRRQSYWTWDGFDIRGYGDLGPVVDCDKMPFDYVTISNNYFHDIISSAGAGIISTLGGRFMQILNNTMKFGFRASGMRIGKADGFLVQGNTIDLIGRTAIYFQETKNSIIDGNFVTNINGIHGNGISIYLINLNTTITNNYVNASIRPVTLEGDYEPDNDLNMLFTYNVLISEGFAGATSWGRQAMGVKFFGNILLDSRPIISGFARGFQIQKDDRNFTAQYNIADGVGLSSPNIKCPPYWIVQNNYLTNLNSNWNRDFPNNTLITGMRPLIYNAVSGNGTVGALDNRICSYLVRNVTELQGQTVSVGKFFYCKF